MRLLQTYIVECRGDGFWVILKEEACDGGVVNVGWPVICLPHHQQAKHCQKEQERFESHIESIRPS